MTRRRRRRTTTAATAPHAAAAAARAVESVTVADDGPAETLRRKTTAGAPEGDGVAVEICREGDEAWLSAAVRKATMAKATGPPVNGSVPHFRTRLTVVDAHRSARRP